jgi:hypothetical protein
VARRLTPCRNLRHVDDRRHARFLRGLGEIGGSAKDARRNRMEEVGRADAFHGRADVIYVGEIADGDINTALPQGSRTLVIRAHISPDALSQLQQGVNGGAPGTTPRSAYKNLGLAHGFAPSELRAYAPMNARVRAYALIVKAVYSAASCFDAFFESIKKSGVKRHERETAGTNRERRSRDRR